MTRLLLPFLLAAATGCAQAVDVTPEPVGAAPVFSSSQAGKPLDCGATAMFPAEGSPHPLFRRAAAAAWTPPQPVPPPPPNAPAYLATPEPVLQPTGDPRVDAFRQRVFAEGGPAWRPYLLRAFANVRSNPAVISAIEEKPSDIAGYVMRYVTPERVATGQRLYRELQGRQLFEGAQTVPLEVLLALWGALSDYGANPPPFDMVEALANLGACGKGPSWGSFSIYQAVRILAEAPVERAKAKAYASGRIGQNRLFPEQYLNWAEDGDGDGKVDIWTSRADILKNIQRNGIARWQMNAPPLVEIQPVAYRADQPNEIRRLRASIGWEGVHRQVDGKPWPRGGESIYGWNSVVRLGPDGPTYVASPDLEGIGRQDPYAAYYYSEPERGFAIAVALLAEQIAGRPGPSRPIG